MMVTRKQHIANILLSLVRLSLVVLWLPVAVEKLWDPMGFRSTLLRQPFPDWWADVLFWLLPLLELLAAVLIAWPKNQQRIHQGMWLSAILLFGFTLFILFGVLGWYEKRPCGCGSVISGLSWNDHLWFNAVFLLLSILGIWLTWPRHTATADGNPPSSLRASGMGVEDERSNPSYIHCDNKKRFPRKFAPFPARGRVSQYKDRENLKQAFPIDYGTLDACPRQNGYAFN